MFTHLGPAPALALGDFDLSLLVTLGLGASLIEATDVLCGCMTAEEEEAGAQEGGTADAREEGWKKDMVKNLFLN